ncbi:MAG: response regulator [Bacteroidales bacterium]|nr:response regulator [Bacteroidales bacterium]
MAYKVLWVDDEINTPDLKMVAALASRRYGINMETACESSEQALVYLDHPNDFDAVVLDARFLSSLRGTNTTSGSIRGLREVTERLEELRTNGHYLPVLIYTGQPDLYKSEDFKATYYRYKMFQKNEEGTEELFKEIIRAVNEREVTQVKLKYAPLFDICMPKYMFDSSDITERLLNYAVQVEHNDTKKTEYLNDIRKLIEELFEKCEQMGLLIPGIQSLNDKSKFLCDNKMQEYIPPYVQESIRFILRCTQEGSHYGVADTDVRNGIAPFLFRSLFFSLSTVLVWWKQFIDSDCDKTALGQCAESIQLDTETAKTDKKTAEPVPKTATVLPYTYIVEKDSDGCYHCGPYLMSTRHGQAIEGRMVTVLEEEANTRKKIDVYPRFAKKVQ